MKEAASKRSKSDAWSASIIRESLLQDPAVRQDLTTSYRSGKPFPHCVIPDVCDPSLLKLVRDEIIENIEATYKETDLFKMLQTGDLANLDRLDPVSAAKLPTLLALRDAIYSSKFRAFVSDVTGCGELSDKTDCACNIHPLGGHLLCHDDVIGDRRVSYIIYLTDPDVTWTAADGGALELYPEAPDTPHVPDVSPTAFVLPIWNSMAMFTVEAGRSFHSIQEVFTSEKPRMSIQGWFHSRGIPENGNAALLATLRQLQARPGEEDDLAKDFEAFSVHSTAEDLSPADLEFLSSWVSAPYLNDENAASRIRSRFQEDGSVQLNGFLCEERSAQLAAAIAGADAADALGCGRVPSYEAGVGSGWTTVGPAHKQRYLSYAGIATGTSPGALLHALKVELFNSPAFARLIRRLTTLTLTHYRCEVRRFRPGLDYTVAHYGGLTRDPRLDAVLCFVDASNNESAEVWESGEVGGFEAYLLADEDEDAPAEVYRAVNDEESGVLNVSPGFNTLSLVLRDEGLMRFIKYVSCQAPGSRWDVAAVYVPEDDSDDEDA